MKRKLLILTVAVLCTVMLAMAVSAAETYGNFTYERNGTGVTITDYDANQNSYDTFIYYEDVVIPSRIDGYPVTKIGDRAFEYEYFSRIEIPSTVTEIGEYAFSNAEKLEKIEFPSSVKTIGRRAMYGCEMLTYVKLPEGLKAIPEYMFYNCTALESVIIPESVTSIGNDAFSNCSSLKYIRIPAAVESIGSYAFEACDALYSIRFSSSSKLSEIGYRAIDDLSSLKYIFNANAVINADSNYFDEYYFDGFTVLYGIDDVCMVVPEENEQKYMLLGWLDHKNDDIKVYAADGRSKTVRRSEVAAQEKVGWRKGTVVYAADGRMKFVSPFKVNEYTSVGWYTSRADAYVYMYAVDGRCKEVFRKDVEANKAVGWYTEPVIYMYSLDGRSKIVESSKVAANKKVGWYDDYSDTVQWVYSPKDMKLVYKADVQREVNVGWRSTPYPMVTVAVLNYDYERTTYKLDLSFINTNAKGKEIYSVYMDTYYYDAYGNAVSDYDGDYYDKWSGYVWLEHLAYDFYYADLDIPSYCDRVDLKNIKVEYEDGTSEYIGHTISVYKE